MAAEIEEIEALVVSEETTKGADAINVARRERGFAPLAVVTVGLVGGQDVASKLSSTALRQAEAAQRARDAKD
jgi:phosphopantetheine adenylyltransferase